MTTTSTTNIEATTVSIQAVVEVRLSDNGKLLQTVNVDLTDASEIDIIGLQQWAARRVLEVF
jgi:hypothetical protein